MSEESVFGSFGNDLQSNDGSGGAGSDLNDTIMDDESEYEPEPAVIIHSNSRTDLRSNSALEGHAAHPGVTTNPSSSVFTPREVKDPYTILRLEEQRYKDLSPIVYIFTKPEPHSRLSSLSLQTVCHEDIQCIDTHKEHVFTGSYPAPLDSGVEKVICDWFGNVAVALDLYDRPDFDGSQLVDHESASEEVLKKVSQMRRIRTALMELKTILLIITRPKGTSEEASSGLVAKAMGFNGKGLAWMRTGEALLFGSEPQYVFSELQWVRGEVRKLCMRELVEKPNFAMEGNLMALKGGNFYPIAWADFVAEVLTKFACNVKTNVEVCKPECALRCVIDKRHEPVCEWV